MLPSRAVVCVPLVATASYGTASPCPSLADTVELQQFNGTFLNSTYYPVKALNVSNEYNSIAFCEVYASISYGSNDSLTFALWLPTEAAHYRHRFMAVGNGGMAGEIDYAGMLTQLSSGFGFAVAGGNAGHLASENNDGEGEPGVYLPYLHDVDQPRSWIHDAISLFTPAARAIVGKYYGKESKHSYYVGCSTGGAQGFALAQYHPELFDGIVAGCPGNWYSHLALNFLWNAQATNSFVSFLDQCLLNFTTNAVLDAFDNLDGVEDGVLENPLQCDFDMNPLACSSDTPEYATCLTQAQLAAAKAIYAGPINSVTGEQLYPGFSLGSEIEWLLQEGNLAEAFSIAILQNLVYNDLSYDSGAFDWASNVADIDAKAGTLIDEIDPDLSAFRDHGGKMLVYQGWADPFNAATWPIEHLEQIEGALGGDVSDFFELFMVPGGGHCGAASYYPQVSAVYHTVEKMIEWIERDERPKQVMSSEPTDGSGRTRKLCPWPEVARLASVGHEDDWESYFCSGGWSRVQKSCRHLRARQVTSIDNLHSHALLPVPWPIQPNFFA